MLVSVIDFLETDRAVFGSKSFGNFLSDLYLLLAGVFSREVSCVKDFITHLLRIVGIVCGLSNYLSEFLKNLLRLCTIFDLLEK